jgi:hypothetical protein
MEINMRTVAKLQLRLPEDLKKWLEDAALRNDRSMNGQAVAILKEKMAEQSAVNDKASHKQG